MATKTLGYVEAEAMVNNMADKLAYVGAETVGDTLGNVKVNALVPTLEGTQEMHRARN